MLALTGWLTGCMTQQQISTTVDGRAVNGFPALWGTANTAGSGDEHSATITLGGKTGAIQLPTNWNRIDLVESSDFIVVSVDGRKCAKILPAIPYPVEFRP